MYRCIIANTVFVDDIHEYIHVSDTKKTCRRLTDSDTSDTI